MVFKLSLRRQFTSPLLAIKQLGNGFLYFEQGDKVIFKFLGRSAKPERAAPYDEAALSTANA
jgi:hypothetical protein